jgi:hypothetical protein
VDVNKLLTRGLLGIVALAVPAGVVMALPMAANAAPATHVTDASSLTANTSPYPNGSSFVFYDGNGDQATFTNYVYKDVVTPSGNETEVFIGNTANSVVPNNTGSVVTYNSATNPNTPGQTALSFVSGKTTTNWTMTIQPDGEWNLTANFSK